jgi:hypothetical protein
MKVRTGTGFPVGTVVSSNGRDYQVQRDGSWRVLEYTDTPPSKSQIFQPHPRARELDILALQKEMAERAVQLAQVEGAPDEAPVTA